MKNDYEPYFDRWNSVLHYPNPALKKPLLKIHGLDSAKGGSVPCYQHKTCGGMVLLGAFNLGKYPPAICPECKADTRKEVADGEGTARLFAAD